MFKSVGQHEVLQINILIKIKHDSIIIFNPDKTLLKQKYNEV